MTIPRSIREILEINTPGKVLIDVAEKEKSIKIKKSPLFFDIAGTFKPKRALNAVKIRKLMETSYERI